MPPRHYSCLEEAAGKRCGGGDLQRNASCVAFGRYIFLISVMSSKTRCCCKNLLLPDGRRRMVAVWAICASRLCVGSPHSQVNGTAGGPPFGNGREIGRASCRERV